MKRISIVSFTSSVISPCLCPTCVCVCVWVGVCGMCVCVEGTGWVCVGVENVRLAAMLFHVVPLSIRSFVRETNSHGICSLP